MKINSRPPNPIQSTPGASKPGASQAGESFQLGGKGPSSRVLEKVGAQFSAKDLDQPDKAEKAVRTSFGVMLEDQPVSGSLPAERREALADFMSADPILHQKMLTYLRKTLS